MLEKEYLMSKSEERKIIFECIKDTKQLSIVKMWIELISSPSVAFKMEINHLIFYFYKTIKQKLQKK